jgi:hypothetical protein
MSYSGLELPGLVQSPLARADVTLLELLASPPREDRRPLWRFLLATENRQYPDFPQSCMKDLGEDIRRLLV